MRNLAKRLWKEEEGQDLVEYALLLTLITLAVVASVQSVSATIQGIFTNVNTELT